MQQLRPHRSPIVRRHALRTLAAAAIAVTAPILAVAQAQTFPSGPIRIVVPFPAGGITDNAARGYAQRLSEELKVPVVVENKGGAGGSIGAAAVARAAPDGQTLLYAPASVLTINPYLYKGLQFDGVKDFKPVVESLSGGMILLANPKVQAKTLDELFTYVRANPGKLSYSSAGNGSFHHLNMELLKSTANLNMVHVPYGGAAPALNALLAGQVDIGFDVTATSLQHVKAGKLKAFAVNTPKRLDSLPDVPTLSETVNEFDGRGWQAFFVPAATPAAIIEKLNVALNKAIKDPRFVETFNNLGLESVGGSPDAVDRKMNADVTKWSKVIKSADVKVE